MLELLQHEQFAKAIAIAQVAVSAVAWGRSALRCFSFSLCSCA
jgi:hypothetical protein